MTIKYVAQHCDIASGTRDLMPSNNDIHIVNLNCKVIKIDINIKMQNVRDAFILMLRKLKIIPQPKTALNNKFVSAKYISTIA